MSAGRSCCDDTVSKSLIVCHSSHACIPVQMYHTAFTPVNAPQHADFFTYQDPVHALQITTYWNIQNCLQAHVRAVSELCGSACFSYKQPVVYLRLRVMLPALCLTVAPLLVHFWLHPWLLWHTRSWAHSWWCI